MGLDIVIVGGGLAGMAAGGFLRKQHNVTILERGAPNFTGPEYGISVMANAYGLLQKAGIKDANLDMAVMTEIWDYAGDTNKEIFVLHHDTRDWLGVPCVLTTRSQLHHELIRFATSPDLEGKPAVVHNHVQVASVDTEAGVVTAADGKTYKGDVIIGADGINSVARNAIVHGRADAGPGKAATHDLLAFMSRVPLDKVKGMPGLEFLLQPDSHAGIVNWLSPRGGWSDKRRILAYHVNPRELNLVGYAPEAEFAAQFDEKRTSLLPDIPVSRVKKDYEDFSPQVTALFDLSPTIEAWRIRDIEPVDTWTRGKALIIGDAAHAVTPHAGQGCNTAFEDAEALGYLLSSASSAADVQAAFAKFVQIRKARTQDIAQTSRHIGAILPAETLKQVGELDRAAFGQRTYAYAGAEAAVKQLEASA